MAPDSGPARHGARLPHAAARGAAGEGRAAGARDR